MALSSTTTSNDSLFILQPTKLDTEETASTRFLPLSNDYSRCCMGKPFYYWRKACFRTKYLAIAAFILTFMILAIILVTKLYNTNNEALEETLVPPDPETTRPPSWSKLKVFKTAAVCADSEKCALIGKSILEKNGSAVDAALAALICTGLIHMQSMGFGGGFMMTIYEKSARSAIVLNARDSAPSAASRDMFRGLGQYASRVGGLSINVPGELGGYWKAHQRFGKLPWADLFQPTIELCEGGFNLNRATFLDLHFNATNIRTDPYLRGLFVDESTGEFRPPGSIIRPKAFCKTLRIIAQKGAEEFYNGSIGSTLVEDIQKRGSIITKKDLSNYRAKWEDPFQTEIFDGTKMYSVESPGGGPLLALALHVFGAFSFGPKDVADINSTIKTYHRMAETFKYVYALRTEMGDPEFVNITDVLTKLASKEFVRSISTAINENLNTTFQDPTHYGMAMWENSEDHGTAHISVLAGNGDAVSVTSTINSYFGSGVASERTGILMNNGIDDFGIPDRPNYFGLPPSERNFIEPGKRPLTSMTPTILVDENGDVTMVIGAAGGTKITTALALVIARYLWMQETIKEAVDAPRIHHQLLPMQFEYEYGVRKEVIDGLKALGHKTWRFRNRASVVCGLVKKNHTIYANADYRKGGEVHGID